MTPVAQMNSHRYKSHAFDDHFKQLMATQYKVKSPTVHKSMTFARK